MPTHAPATFDRVLDLPPPFTSVTLREAGDAFAHATAIASAAGAGTLVFVGRFDLAEFAVVLQPDEPLWTARRAHYAGMIALADALLAFAPPEKAVTVDWPDAIHIDGGLIGGGRLGWPHDASEDEPPAWLVFGAMIRMVSMTGVEPGVHPLATALDQEGFEDAGAAKIAASFARHLMVAVDAWQSGEFAEVERELLARLPRENGIIRKLDDNGDLLIRRAGKAETRRYAFLPALATPSWLDTDTRAPKLSVPKPYERRS
ncbi:MAG: biotin/lipoate--protein ligase family protein [Hyphomicrobiaceae bacterium]